MVLDSWFLRFHLSRDGGSEERRLFTSYWTRKQRARQEAEVSITFQVPPPVIYFL